MASTLRSYLFHEEPGITLYCGDCREVLPLVMADPFMIDTAPRAFVTDPPYGIDLRTDYATRGRSRRAVANDHIPVRDDDKPFDPSWLLLFSGATDLIVWGANHYFWRLPQGGSWLIWDKRVREGVGVNDHADAEMAWISHSQPVRVFRHMWNGFWRDSERQTAYHPTQKPEALMLWCLTFVRIGSLVVDPYCGSGPTLSAAKRAGFRAIGIEIEPRYCEIAVKRLRQEVLAL